MDESWDNRKKVGHHVKTTQKKWMLLAVGITALVCFFMISSFLKHGRLTPDTTDPAADSQDQVSPTSTLQTHQHTAARTGHHDQPDPTDMSTGAASDVQLADRERVPDNTDDHIYSSQILTDAITELHTLNAQHKAQANITEADITSVWSQVDAAITAGYMSSVEGIKHKQWLASLIPSDMLTQRLETEMKEVADRLKAESAQQQQANATDPRFLAYKAEEKRLTAEILGQYPDDKVKAAAELNKALQAFRTEIYQ